MGIDYFLIRLFSKHQKSEVHWKCNLKSGVNPTCVSLHEIRSPMKMIAVYFCIPNHGAKYVEYIRSTVRCVFMRRLFRRNLGEGERLFYSSIQIEMIF